ncbi:hypothetical protein TanjilG_10332 [Lupinus angustifolius]|uniref:Uncharacterized protein n=1 Tax=Lupinus angustifolius TaxID=3871 RepID=A0A4P1R3U5_LUPAN|nr:hypothetical protein TanjilG_10332 [Lupinus angustifolius]
MACRIDGFIAAVAHTNALRDGPVTGRAVDVIAAANTAAEVALRLVTPVIYTDRESFIPSHFIYSAHCCHTIWNMLSCNIDNFAEVAFVVNLLYWQLCRGDQYHIGSLFSLLPKP